MAGAASPSATACCPAGGADRNGRAGRSIDDDDATADAGIGGDGCARTSTNRYTPRPSTSAAPIGRMA